MTQLVGWPLFAAALLSSAERGKNLQSLHQLKKQRVLELALLDADAEASWLWSPACESGAGWQRDDCI